jgi:hypothetical protein
MELRSFTVKLYARFGAKARGCLKTSVSAFRLFHSEANAFVSASCDPDKGCVLDALAPAPAVRTRPGGGGGPTPAHVPYLKAVVGDASAPASVSAKAAWRFEGVDRTTAATVLVTRSRQALASGARSRGHQKLASLELAALSLSLSLLLRPAARRVSFTLRRARDSSFFRCARRTGSGTWPRTSTSPWTR